LTDTFSFLGGLIGAFATVIGGGVGFLAGGPPGTLIGGVGVAGLSAILDYVHYTRCMNKVHKMKDDAMKRYKDCIQKCENQ
jgi:hypothetical protein